ncbi:MAG TPA: SET domain-containing protein-lysine N-methyltransferase [Usitatibacteraceae bacterium]|jgi:SET domain-containing protein|nr:SET domain-containing protein-lysine N-methyltransferase [Usitatibacteraceae bacterium]HRA22063.1 SET domain-containing protein-lysine N-methyltransferase [Usitatibacteraceae bacterium]
MRRIAYSSRYHDALVVGPSPITGRGLFAGCAIPRRAKIGEFEGEVIPLAEARRRATGLRIVAIVELDRTAIDARGMRTGFRFINHSCAPNTFMRRTRDRAEFYALRDIAAGEELTVDYRPSHHDGRLRCRCGAPRCGGWI